VKLAFFCLALGALPAPGQVLEGPVPRAAVYFEFQHEPPGPVLDALELEVGSLLSPMGARLEWRPLNAVRQGDVAEELAVATFQGRCDPGPVALGNGPGILGRTHVSDGVVLPFCEVDCDRIRAFVQPALVPLNADKRARDFGRAVGRVLAHELYHIFARTTHHESRGLAKSSLSVQELMAREFRLPEGAIRPLVAFAGGAPPGGPRSGKSLFSASGCTGCHGPHQEGSGRGPALRMFEGQGLSGTTLASRLGDKASKMYRRAGNLRASWPSFSESDIDRLAGYLSRPPE
jgi:mono/diheme cytochrome c family protein